MKRKQFSKFQLAVVILMALCTARRSPAGIVGSWVDAAGKGKAVLTLYSPSGTGYGTSGSVVVQNPSASASVPLPNGSYCTITGLAPGIWYSRGSVTGGATADNPVLEEANGVVPPAPCAEYDMITSAKFLDDKSGIYTLTATISPGAAIWTRGFEYKGDKTSDELDLADLENASVSVPLWNKFIAGPFPAFPEDCNVVKFDFTTERGNNKVYFVLDTVANSQPLQLSCPSSTIEFGAGQPVVYPTPTVSSGGCGGVTFTYSPAVESLPCGLTEVTVTGKDAAGNTATCVFTVNKKPAFAMTCPSVTFSCDRATPSYPAPTITGACGAVSVIYAPLASALPAGVPTTVNATATDAFGNTATCSFTATRNELTVDGFYAPLNQNFNTTCGARPVKTYTLGSSIPVKFKTLCGGVSFFGSAKPEMSITRCSDGAEILHGNFQIVANEWHFNWDTTGVALIPRTVNTFELRATLGSQLLRSVIVQVR
jgi:hypothetical protein